MDDIKLGLIFHALNCMKCYFSSIVIIKLLLNVAQYFYKYSLVHSQCILVHSQMYPSTFSHVSQYILKCILVLSHMYPSTFSHVSQYFLKCILVHSQMYPSTFSNVSQYFLTCSLVHSLVGLKMILVGSKMILVT